MAGGSAAGTGPAGLIRRRRWTSWRRSPRASGASSMFRKALVAFALVVGVQLGLSAPAEARHAALVSQASLKPAIPAAPCGGATLICTGAGAVVGAIGDVVTGGAQELAGSVMSGVVNWAASGAAWLVKAVAAQIERS